MSSNFQFQVQHHLFDKNISDKIKRDQFVEGLWPLVYIISDDRTHEAYVGETTDAVSRMGIHLNTDSKKRLSMVHLVTSEMFNKSATLDIESNLIRYMSGDGKYKLLNANIGIANHTYYQKSEVYWSLFKNLWNRLQKEGIAQNPIDWIDNSDLFKYSPYKSLSHEQIHGIVSILNALLLRESANVIVEGGAGTGKSIMAVFLFKLLVTPKEELEFKDFGTYDEVLYDLAIKLKVRLPNPKIALVVPMKSFRTTLQKVFKQIKGLKSSMVIGPSEVVKDYYDLIVVDESHRLRQRKNLGTYFGSFDNINKRMGLSKTSGNELDWIQQQAKLKVYFFDSNQTIKPSDINYNSFEKVINQKDSVKVLLKSQFRVKAGTGYIEYLNSIFNSQITVTNNIPKFKNYEFLLFDSFAQMKKVLDKKENEFGLCRMIAGYSWPWRSNNDSSIYDIEIEGIKMKWNSVSEDWVNSFNAPFEVGCIHTTQGYDLNYAGIIFGNEITYDFTLNKIVIRPEKYYDKNGKNSINNPAELENYILNIYRTIMLRGIRGTFVYVCDDNLRKYLKRYIQSFGEYDQNKFISIAAED